MIRALKLIGVMSAVVLATAAPALASSTKVHDDPCPGQHILVWNQAGPWYINDDGEFVCGPLQGEPGPAGPEGPQGPAGEQGPQGEPGADGQDGADGLDGQSVYAYVNEETGCVDIYQGEQLVASVCNGVDGVDGQDGADGLPGADGAAGVDGVDGQDGAPGSDGSDGVATVKRIIIHKNADGTVTTTVLDDADLPDELAETGFDASGAIAALILLLGAGSMALIVSRRSRR